MPASDANVIVIGAGAAGLAAARDLRRAGRNVLCLEARGRIGGRILTVHDPLTTVPVELGAEFVHGRPSQIWDIVREARLEVRETAGHMVSAADSGGDMDRVLKDVKQRGREEPDESFLSFVERGGYAPEDRQTASGYVEGFNAARKERIGVASLAQDERAADAIDGECSFHIGAGYDALAQALDCGSVRLHSIVEAVEWRRGSASVRVRSALDGHREMLLAERVVITVPLGVLQAGAIRFDPEPPHIMEAARALEFGQAVRITLRFDRAFWEEKEKFAGASFIFSEEPVFPTWWTTRPVVTPIIIGWSAGPKADPLLGKSQMEVITAALGSLERIVGTPPARLENAWFHDWHADPFARGAYSYVPAGALPARRRLSEPVEDTLYFAGEATDLLGYGGTVHGAIASGNRAAAQILGR
uniref:Tryptophan 2-monooxygenase n=1 Tax=Solibacter usitatus (strain Ellin6076) TaxID=234267 RepID=Q01NZ3_SOLUE